MNCTTTAVKALLFDVFGTMVDWRESVSRQAKTLLNRRGIAVDWRGFADAWRGKYQPAMEQVRSGRRDFVRLDVLHRESLMDVLQEFGITDLTEPEIDHLNRAWHQLDPWPDSVPGLMRLKRQFILGTMSNGNVALLVNMAKYAELPWDVILGAEPAQAYKPLPETYKTAVDWLGLTPGQVMMCSAHNSDLLAARACGLATAFIARPTEYGLHQDRDCKAEHAFDVVTESVLGLAHQLGC